MIYQLQPQQAILNNDGITTAAGWALIYNVDSITGEYINASYEYLPVGISLPAHAYLDSPKKNNAEKAIIRNTKGWAYPADHRGKTVYNIKNGLGRIVDFVGDIPSDYTLLTPTSEFDSWTGDSWVNDNEKAKAGLIKRITAEQKNYVNEADTVIFDLNEAIELNLATEYHKELLSSWRQYRFSVKQVNINEPDLIVWPKVPQYPDFTGN